MRYLIRQKFLTWGDRFAIQDASGEDAYFVAGKAISFGAQLSFQDLQGNELAFIKQRVFSWRPTFEIHQGGELRAIVSRSWFAFFRQSFTVDVLGRDSVEATGDFTDHEYTFVRGERVVATASKQWFAWTDTYGVDVDAEEDEVLILASVIVIDQAYRRNKS